MYDTVSSCLNFIDVYGTQQIRQFPGRTARYDESVYAAGIPEYAEKDIVWLAVMFDIHGPVELAGFEFGIFEAHRAYVNSDFTHGFSLWSEIHSYRDMVVDISLPDVLGCCIVHTAVDVCSEFGSYSQFH